MLGRTIEFKCECGDRVSREATEAEYNDAVGSSYSEAAEIHKVSHSYDDATAGLGGYEAMEAADKWHKDHPEAEIVGVDDSSFMSSSLVLIPHEDAHRYIGCSVHFIPQNDDPPVQFFLYPGHLECLKAALERIEIRQNKPRLPKPNSWQDAKYE